MYQNLVKRLQIPEHISKEVKVNLEIMQNLASIKRAEKYWKAAGVIWNEFIEAVETYRELAPYILNTVPAVIALFHEEKNRSDILRGDISPNEALRRAKGEDLLSMVCAKLSGMAYLMGADPNSQKTLIPLLYQGIPTIHATIDFGNYNGFTTALKYGAKMDTPSCDGEYPIHYIYRRVKDNRSLDPIDELFRCYQNESMQKIRAYVIEHTKDINVLDKPKRSVVFYAIQQKASPEELQRIIKKGARLDIQDWEGNTPLHFAVKIGRENIVKNLLQYHPNPNLQNNEGKTPLHIAAEFGDIECMKDLLAKGAKVNLRDQTGKVASEYLSVEKRVEWRKVRCAIAWERITPRHEEKQGLQQIL